MRKDAPLSYRFGGAFFCELPFFVDKHVLIPRFDTEILVETAIKCIPDGGSVLDLCTGSGCIAVVMAKHGYKVTGIDISRGAVKIAKKNARLNNVDVKFVRGDVTNIPRHGCAMPPPSLKGELIHASSKSDFSVSPTSNDESTVGDTESLLLIQDKTCIPPSKKGVALRSNDGGCSMSQAAGDVLYNAVVCNPPYIKTAEIGKYDKSTLFEPRIALDGGADGLRFYRAIAKSAQMYLKNGGTIFFEISYEQAESVKTILEQGGFCDIKVVKDVQGLERVIYGRYSGNKEKI